MLLAAALPLLSAIPSAGCRGGLRLTLSAPEAAVRGEQMTCTLTVSSSGIPAQFELTVEAENSFTGEYSTRVMPLSVGKKPASLSWQLTETHSGVVRLSCTSVREFDSFGLFSRKRICTAQAEVLLPPQTFPVSVCLDQAAEVLLDSESYSAQKAGNDPGETFRIREYVPGDPIRQIHWKLSEKMGTLMVRRVWPAGNEPAAACIFAGEITFAGTAGRYAGYDGFCFIGAFAAGASSYAALHRGTA